MGNLPIEEFMHISIPGKYNSAFVFGVIFMLILLHYFQSGWILLSKRLNFTLKAAKLFFQNAWIMFQIYFPLKKDID